MLQICRAEDVFWVLLLLQACCLFLWHLGFFNLPQVLGWARTISVDRGWQLPKCETPHLGQHVALHRRNDAVTIEAIEIL